MDYFEFDGNGNPYIDTHIPYCSCKVEDALMDSKLFRQSRLSLFACVPISHVSGMLNPRMRSEEYVDYLICRGEEVLMAIFLVRNASDYGVGNSILTEWDKERKYLPSVILLESRMFHAGDELPAIVDSVIREPDRVHHKCPISALTQTEFQRFRASSKGLLFVNGGTYITEYGRKLGLFRGRFSANTHRICAFPQDLMALEKSEFQDELIFPSVVSYAQRVKRVEKGLPCDKDSVIKAIRAFGQMPLSEYLRDFPDGLRAFEFALGKDATFQDAARYVAKLMRDEQPGVCAFTSWKTLGKTLMQHLADPILAAK